MTSAPSPNSLTRIPGFDPRLVPVEPAHEVLPAVTGQRLLPDAIRERFAAPPRWAPELVGDTYFLEGRQPRPASVLVPIVDHGAGPSVLLTERTAHLHDHAGQVAFPGGRQDPEDLTPIDTALRETHEEIGLPRERVEVVGQLPVYATGTGYLVTPVVGVVVPGFELRLDDFEVADAFEVPLEFLMDPRNHELRRVRTDTGERVFYSMTWREARRDRFIWGATAAMLRNFYRFLSA